MSATVTPAIDTDSIERFLRLKIASVEYFIDADRIKRRIDEKNLASFIWICQSEEIRERSLAAKISDFFQGRDPQPTHPSKIAEGIAHTTIEISQRYIEMLGDYIAQAKRGVYQPAYDELSRMLDSLEKNDDLVLFLLQDTIADLRAVVKSLEPHVNVT